MQSSLFLLLLKTEVREGQEHDREAQEDQQTAEHDEPDGGGHESVSCCVLEAHAQVPYQTQTN